LPSDHDTSLGTNSEYSFLFSWIFCALEAT